MSNWQTEQAERNKRSLARLSKNLPEIFPPAVLTRALGRPFIPPTPRLAIDCTGARIHFALIDWRVPWRSAPEHRKAGIGSSVAIARARYRSRSERHQRHIESVPTHADLDSAASADSLFIALDGTLICGTPAPIKTRPGTAPV
jgi:hypothetical protein